MDLWKIILLGVVTLLIAAVLIEVWWKRGKTKHSLAETLGKASKYSQDDKPELGMEAIDMDVVRRAERLDTTLERKNSIPRR